MSGDRAAATKPIRTALDRDGSRRTRAAGLELTKRHLNLHHTYALRPDDENKHHSTELPTFNQDQKPILFLLAGERKAPERTSDRVDARRLPRPVGWGLLRLAHPFADRRDPDQ